jgi:hypothetical protein
MFQFRKGCCGRFLPAVSLLSPDSKRLLLNNSRMQLDCCSILLGSKKLLLGRIFFFINIHAVAAEQQKDSAEKHLPAVEQHPSVADQKPCSVEEETAAEKRVSFFGSQKKVSAAFQAKNMPVPNNFS